MVSNKPAKQTLRVVEQEQLLHEEDGDILLPLKRVRDQYTLKAKDLEEKIPGPGASDEKDILKRTNMLKVIARYRQAADAVQVIIGVVNVRELAEEPAPIDRTEEIFSDNSKELAEDLCGGGDLCVGGHR